MTETTFPMLGRQLVVVAYYDGLIPKTKVGWAKDIFLAQHVIKKLQKEILRDKISRFLNMRMQIMEYHGGLRTQARLEILQCLKNNFDFYGDKSLEANCKWILMEKEKFSSLMPGEKSTYYQTTKETLEYIFSFCESKTRLA